jgi:sphinganine-1-phosphate aldolase
VTAGLRRTALDVNGDSRSLRHPLRRTAPDVNGDGIPTKIDARAGKAGRYVQDMREHGLAASDILGQLNQRQSAEPDVHAGRLFGLVYPSGRSDIEELIVEVNSRYLFGNALNPFRFPELARLEAQVIEAVASLLCRPATGQPAGAMTSGGTESILLAMLSHRQRARARGIEQPQILAPASAHPAYAKAAHYFGLELVQIPLDGMWRADLDAARSLVTERTAVVVASAFSYPYGIMDPVEELAALAAEAGAGCHVDACIGAFVLPFLERLGHDVPLFDFRLPGVTTMSADIHKYGYVPKGASVVLHRQDDWLEMQGFRYDGWGAGTYGSAAMAGARPASPIACSWAVISYLGVDGYTGIVRDLAEATGRFRSVVEGLDGIGPVGEPIGPVLAYRATTDELDLHAVADAMAYRGWYLNRNLHPRGIQVMLSPRHAHVMDDLVADFTTSVAAVRNGAVARTSRGAMPEAARYA